MTIRLTDSVRYHETRVLPVLAPGQIWFCTLTNKKGDVQKGLVLLAKVDEELYPNSPYTLMRSQWKLGTCDPETGHDLRKVHTTFGLMQRYKPSKRLWTHSLFSSKNVPLVYLRPFGVWSAFQEEI